MSETGKRVEAVADYFGLRAKGVLNNSLSAPETEPRATGGDPDGLRDERLIAFRNAPSSAGAAIPGMAINPTDGAAAERARIRKMALDRCEKLEEAGELLPAATLRDFAARLEDK